MEVEDVPLESEAFVPRGYQVEMLETSLKQNIIVAMDTGSGKTPIAVMRIAAELESPGSKRVWFLCPKVALAQQQHRVVQRQLPSALCKVIVGSDGCQYWSSQTIWDEVLLNVQVVVCTPEILYDALCHGFVRMAGISLLIFDEAHYCKDNHPANRILTNFYHPARLSGIEVPHILGLTASPAFGNEVSGLETIEKNLDSICRTPRINREELLQHTHCPKLVQLSYEKTALGKPRLLTDLEQLFFKLSIYDDPYIISLHKDDERSQEYIQKVILKGKTDCRDQIVTLIQAANNVWTELGTWAAEWYILYCIQSFRDRRRETLFYVDSLAHEEFTFLLTFFEGLDTTRNFTANPPSEQNITPKVATLIGLLENEMEASTETNTTLAGIVFVQTRIAVCMLKRLLENYSFPDDRLRLGLSFGTSTNPSRKTMLCDCLMRDKSVEDIETVLDDLRNGKRNLLISTNVVEEGIDITACNTIICFDQPPNLVSFVQRRGRARDAYSKYFIMFPRIQVATGVSKWIKLEEQMKLKYMDHMRELERLEELEMSENASRTYRVEATGAQLQLGDAQQHLSHLCNTLGDVRYASNKPVFMMKSDNKFGPFMCEVILPNIVNNKFRRFSSSRYWNTERSARDDAAFEACVMLHKNALLNDNLLPIKSLSEQEASMYQVVEKRPNIVDALQEYNPWRHVAELSTQVERFTQREVVIQEGVQTRLRMKLIMPGMPKVIQACDLFIDQSTTYSVSFGDEQPIDAASISAAKVFTKNMLYSVYGTRMDRDQDLLPILFLPGDCPMETPMCDRSTNLGDSKLFDDTVDRENMGLIRDTDNLPYIFLGLETVEITSEDSERPVSLLKEMIKASRLSKRTDFLHPQTAGSAPKQINYVYLDPAKVTRDKLPSKFSHFAAFVPSIQHKIRHGLMVEQFQKTILGPAGISSTSTILEAISSPAAREPVNYQRIEFLGDAILKYYTSVSLMAQHLIYPEGYLAYMKDLVVSNKSAALAAKEIGLDQFIIRNTFTGAKWRPVYIDEANNWSTTPRKTKSVELSTKVLADVVEALIATAYLDGEETESKVLKVLDLLTCSATRTKIKWQPLAELQATLLQATPHLNHVPDLVKHLQQMIGYTFQRPALAVEALTHPGHISLSSDTMTGSASYQRLEFLGDAVLDMIVTRTIYKFKIPTSVFRMHLLRSAAVNQDILGYLALRLKINIETSRLVKNVVGLGQKRDRASNGCNVPDKVPEKAFQSISLPQLLRHTPTSKMSSDMADMQYRCDELSNSLDEALESGSVYPWVLLAELAPEKLASDLIEAVLGAMYIDSHGNLDTCEAWITRLGILPWLRRALEEDIKVWHPKEELGVLVDTKKVTYAVRRNHNQKETFICTLFIAERQICKAQGISKKIAETRAAALAIEIIGKEEGHSIEKPASVAEIRGGVRNIEIEEQVTGP